MTFVNGKSNNVIPVTDRGLAYGDGLFETILVINAELVLEKEHLERLHRDADRLKINIDQMKLKQELQEMLEQIAKSSESKTGVLKMMITRQFSGRGYHYNRNSGSNRILQYYAGLSYPKENWQGIRVGLSDYRLSDNKNLAGIKHLNRFDQVLLQAKIRKPLYQEVLVCGSHGEILEGSFSNLFMVKDNVLLTPNLDKAGVRGVMRDYILNAAAKVLKLEAKEIFVSLDAVLQADETFMCNSVFGVWPVTAIDVKDCAVGKVTLAIQNHIEKLGYRKIYYP